MTKAEKRHFKLGVARYSKQGSNNLLRLFEVYDSLKSFDEVRLLRALKDESFVRHLATVNLQLTNAIVQSMHDLHARDHYLSQIAENMFAARFLNDRGVRDVARKYLKKATSLAHESSQLTLLLCVTEMRRDLVVSYNIDGDDEEMSELLRLQRETLMAVNSELGYVRLRQQVAELFERSLDTRDPELQREVQQILADPLMQDIDQAPTVNSRMLFCRLKADAALLQDKPDEAYEYRLKLLDLWDGNEDDSHTSLIKYKADLLNLFSCCIAAEKFDMFEPTLQKIKALPILSRADRVKHVSSVLYAEFHYYLQNGYLDRCRDILAEIQVGIEQFGAEIPLSRLMTLQLNITVFHFVTGDFAATENCLMALTSINSASVRRDIEAFARILSPVVHYELQKIDLLESRRRSAYRYFKGQPAAYEFEMIVLKYINRLRDRHNGAAALEIFKQFDAALVALEEGLEGRAPLGLTEIRFWVESKISGKPLREVFLAKVAERKDESAGNTAAGHAADRLAPGDELAE